MPAAGSSCHLYLGVMSRARSVRFVLAERDVPVGSSFFGGARRRAPHSAHSERVLGAGIPRRPARGACRAGGRARCRRYTEPVSFNGAPVVATRPVPVSAGGWSI